MPKAPWQAATGATGFVRLKRGLARFVDAESSVSARMKPSSPERISYREGTNGLTALVASGRSPCEAGVQVKWAFGRTQHGSSRALWQ